MNIDFPKFTSEIVIKDIWKLEHMCELMTTSSKYLWKSDVKYTYSSYEAYVVSHMDNSSYFLNLLSTSR